MDDRVFMKRAMKLAARAAGRTSPNPMVGAVLVRSGNIIAEDYHRMPGTPHAEALVIGKAGTRARLSHLYVNLEPCCHTDKRTPPCTKAIINAGIKKVTVAMKDPNPKVSGKGIRELTQAGIEVVSGVMEEEAKKLNEFYVKHITTKMPFVILKTAMTLDGKIATPDGESRWITGEKARREVHRLRNHVDAVLTAIGTVKADNPRLTARIPGGRNPTRVIIDPQLEIPLNALVLDPPHETIIVTQKATLPYQKHYANKLNYLYNLGINMVLFKDKLDLKWLLKRLAETGISSLMIEGGSSLNAHALEDGIVDKVMFFIAPKIIGGKSSYPAVGGDYFRRLEDAYMLKGTRFRQIGEDFLVEGYL